MKRGAYQIEGVQIALRMRRKAISALALPKPDLWSQAKAMIARWSEAMWTAVEAARGQKGTLDM